jgi:hypothetical protein
LYVHAAVPLRLPPPATFFTFRVKQGAFSRASMGLDPRSTQAIFSATFLKGLFLQSLLFL